MLTISSTLHSLEDRGLGVAMRRQRAVLARGAEIVLDVKELEVRVTTRRGIGRAVDGISFTLAVGETLGLIGESGSGKSLTSLAILGLQPQPAAQITGGQILFRGTDLLKKTPAEMRQYRGRRIAMVLQDPMTALNPVFSVGRQLYEPLQLHRHLSGKSLREQAIELLRLLQIPS